jgi:hypothetical protein
MDGKNQEVGRDRRTFVTVDVDKIASGLNKLDYTRVDGKAASGHYTIIEIWKHNKTLGGRTVGRVKEYDAPLKQGR